MAKRYDTNPLDPEFPEKAKAQTVSVGGYTSPTATPFKTAELPTNPGSITEEETRRFNEADLNAHTWQNGPAPAFYQAPAVPADMGEASERKVAKVGVSEKWLVGLPYLPITLGLIAGLIMLLIVPKEENKVRFHAAQGLAAHVGILIVTTILSFIGNVTDLANAGSGIFTAVTTIMLIIFAIKAWRGKPVHIESVDDLTNWLEDKIGPIRS
ncbi:MAG: hypothetical protein KF685_09320 [Acidobacteria bacterium]|nr:hypothetical protein [Acidobacteriota bacterium]